VHDIKRQVLELLVAGFSDGCKRVELGSRLIEDLYMDSLGFVEVVMALNEAFDIQLSEEMVEEWKTVEDICYWVVFMKRGNSGQGCRGVYSR
jgi:acyl carrier protein